MAPSSRDRLSVDLHGLKPELVKRAQAARVSISMLVRDAVARELGPSAEWEPRQKGESTRSSSGAARIKLAIRMTAEEVRQFDDGARSAGLSRGAYLAGVIANVPVLTSGGGRAEHIRALMASNAELATLSRSIYRLTTLLRQANVEPARPYREMLDTVAGNVRRHLDLAARALAGIQPQSRGGRSAVSFTGWRREANEDAPTAE